MDQYIQYIKSYPEAFAIAALLFLYVLEAARPLKILIISSVIAIAFHYFTSRYDEAVYILAAGVVLALIDYFKFSKTL